MSDDPDAVVGGITEDEATGLRILLGLHPDYRTQPPDMRRAAASHYLVPEWHDRPPSNAAQAFQKRHQDRSLQLVIECLRHVYGQEERPTELTAETVRADCLYVVGARRQVIYERSDQVLRARIDGFNIFETVEHGQTGNGGVSFFRSLDADGAGAPGVFIERHPHEPQRRLIRLHLRRPYARGAEVPVRWEEWRFNFVGTSVINWSSYFVTCSFNNDGFELLMRVRFDDELPSVVWWYSGTPTADHRFIEPVAENKLRINSDREVSHRWLARETERRIAYGIKWEWKD